MPEIDERTSRLLKALVERYIEQGEPVASRALTETEDLSISSATARNIMAQLEKLGFIASPHTSAGRVPTPAGYRMFVDTMITVSPLEGAEFDRLRSELNPDQSRKELVASASELLAQVSGLAGVVTMPRREEVALRQVEFLSLTGNRVLVILVMDEKEVENRIIHTERDYTDSELTQAANFINRTFHGQPLTQVRNQLIAQMLEDKARMDHIMQTSIDVASKAFGGDNERTDEEYVVTGESNLIPVSDSLEQLRQLVEAFHSKHDMLHLLDRCLEAQGVRLFIGEESGYEVLDDYSVVTSPYEVDGQRAGVLGVIGPTRMAYDRVIAVVDATARVLGAALTGESR